MTLSMKCPKNVVMGGCIHANCLHPAPQKLIPSEKIITIIELLISSHPDPKTNKIKFNIIQTNSIKIYKKKQFEGIKLN